MITDRPRRLTGVSYVGLQRYFVTTCTSFRKPIFNDTGIAAAVIAKVLVAADRFKFAVVAYCAMPDHLHLLLLAETEDANLEKFIKFAKQVTGYAYRRATKQSLWQPGYH